MIDTVLNLLFRCSHQRLTRPMAPITKAGTPHSQSYVVCLDCGKQFESDLNEMRIGKTYRALSNRRHGVVPPNLPRPRQTKARYALLAALPAAVILGAALSKKKPPKPEAEKAEPSPKSQGPDEA